MNNAFWHQPIPTNSRREQRRQEFREKIIQSAIQLFEKNGCEATTLEEICELAEISRPTFYSYYPSKHDLIQALVEKLWISGAAEFTDEFLSEDLSTQEYIHHFFAMTREQFRQYTRLERDLIRHSMADDNGENSNMTMLSGLTAMFASVYERGRKKGDISSRYEVSFLAEMSMGAISTVMMKWAVDQKYPIEQRLDEVADFTINFLAI